MNFGFNNEAWLEWAIQAEDEAECGIQAGLNLGSHLGEYIRKSQDCNINCKNTNKDSVEKPNSFPLIKADTLG